MKTNSHFRKLTSLGFVLAVSLCRRECAAQSNTFTYQGHLTANGSPANGTYDLRFILYTADIGGSQVGAVLTNSAVAVSGGLFTTFLDFGDGAFANGARWLEIAARTNSGGSFMPLNPRQLVAPAPQALYAVRASEVTGSILANQLSGIVPDTQLSANIPRLNSNAVFTGAVIFNNPANIFSGNGSALTGLPGALSWQVVNGTSQQTLPNKGYIAVNPQLVSLTLPTTPNVGDIVRISGGGSGGWRLAQNDRQSIWTGSLVGRQQQLIWMKTTAPSSNWVSVASSSDGIKLVAALLDGGIYTSTNAGASWTKTSAPANNWWRVTSSSNGNFLAVAARGGGIWSSTNSGLNWAQTTAPSGFPPYWNSLTCSADGKYLVAARDCACFPAVPTGDVWASTDFGVTWSKKTAPNTNTDVFVSLSADGRYLFAASFFDSSGIYISTNLGATWMPPTAPITYWSSIASSSEGRSVVAASFGIYVSTNYGASWTQTTAPEGSNWAGVASSADGTRLLGARFNFGIYTSIDSGVTWTSNSAPSGFWLCTALSDGGNRMIAAQQPGGIYTSYWWATTPGTNGSLYGELGTAVELQHVGEGQFIPLSHEGAITPY